MKKKALEQFYCQLDLATNDRFPGKKSDYLRLKIRSGGKDQGLWDILEPEIATQVSSWPEWSAALSPGKKQSTSNFNRYGQRSEKVDVPKKFGDLNFRFRETGKWLHQRTKELMDQSIAYSLERFYQHPQYQKAIADLIREIPVNRLEKIEEALPLLDALNPKALEKDVLLFIRSEIRSSFEELLRLPFPYDEHKPFEQNLALIMRVQVQLKGLYQDRVSRLIALAERQFQSFWKDEILGQEILPRVRELIHKRSFWDKLL